MKNPVALFVGGVTAVLLELAEPRVRSGVWDHTTFRTDPLGRMERTGLAAMVTVYGARSTADRMIAGVRRLHERVSGVTPAGVPYRASDPELLDWVHATASFGFLEAYRTYVRSLDDAECDRFYAEGVEAARRYGSFGTPTSRAQVEEQFAAMRPRLEPSADRARIPRHHAADGDLSLAPGRRFSGCWCGRPSSLVPARIRDPFSSSTGASLSESTSTPSSVCSVGSPMASRSRRVPAVHGVPATRPPGGPSLPRDAAKLSGSSIPV
jgi:hypothetical protein